MRLRALLRLEIELTQAAVGQLSVCVRECCALSLSPMTPSPCLLHIFFLHAQREREITAAANKWSCCCCRCRCYLVGSLAKRALDHQLQRRRRRRRRSAGGQRSGKVHCHIGKTFTTLSVCVCVCVSLLLLLPLRPRSVFDFLHTDRGRNGGLHIKTF